MTNYFVLSFSDLSCLKQHLLGNTLLWVPAHLFLNRFLKFLFCPLHQECPGSVSVSSLPPCTFLVNWPSRMDFNTSLCQSLSHLYLQLQPLFQTPEINIQRPNQHLPVAIE